MSNLEFFLWQIAFALAVAAIFWTMQGKKTIQITSSRYRLGLGVTLIFCGACFLVNVYLFYNVGKVLRAQELAQPQAPIQAGWGSDLVPAERVRLSNALAASIFVGTGAVTNVVDENGELKPFVPNSQDNERRIAHNEDRANRSAFREGSGLAALVWFFLTVIGFVAIWRQTTNKFRTD